MLSKYINRMKREYSDRLSVLSNILRELSRASVCDEVVAASLQNQIIDIGTGLEEEYNLAGSPILNTLEKLADSVFYLVDATVAEEVRKNAYREIGMFAEGLESDWARSVDENKCRMALVLIIKNEARYVKEWLEFHNMLGVEHFYIYDNESEDDLKEVLRPYIEKGLVTYTLWPGDVVQVPAYNDAIKRYKYDTEYMGFIDTDEFLFPIEGMSIPDTIDSIIEKYNSYDAKVFRVGGIGVNWRSYGTSHIKQSPEGLVIENYTLRGNDDYPANVHIKTVCIPALVREFQTNPHNVFYKDALDATLSEHGSMIPAAFFYDGRCEILRINHYYTRSEEDLYYKMNKRRWPDAPKEVQDEWVKFYPKRLIECNDVEDHIMDRFIEPLKVRM